MEKGVTTTRSSLVRHLAFRLQQSSSKNNLYLLKYDAVNYLYKLRAYPYVSHPVPVKLQWFLVFCKLQNGMEAIDKPYVKFEQNLCASNFFRRRYAALVYGYKYLQQQFYQDSIFFPTQSFYI